MNEHVFSDDFVWRSSPFGMASWLREIGAASVEKPSDLMRSPGKVAATVKKHKLGLLHPPVTCKASDASSRAFADGDDTGGIIQAVQPCMGFMGQSREQILNRNGPHNTMITFHQIHDPDPSKLDTERQGEQTCPSNNEKPIPITRKAMQL